MDILSTDWREKPTDKSSVYACLALANEVDEMLSDFPVADLVELALEYAEAGDIPEPGILDLLRENVNQEGSKPNSDNSPLRDAAIVRIHVKPFMGVGMDYMHLADSPEKALEGAVELVRDEMNASSGWEIILESEIERFQALYPEEENIPEVWLQETIKVSTRMISEARGKPDGNLLEFGSLFEPFFEMSDTSFELLTPGDGLEVLESSLEFDFWLPEDLQLPRDEAVFYALLGLWNKPWD